MNRQEYLEGIDLNECPLNKEYLQVVPNYYKYLTALTIHRCEPFEAYLLAHHFYVLH